MSELIYGIKVTQKTCLNICKLVLMNVFVNFKLILLSLDVPLLVDIYYQFILITNEQTLEQLNRTYISALFFQSKN